MKKATAKEELLRRVIGGGLTEDDALSWMILLHTHQIRLEPGTLDGDQGAAHAGEPPALGAETQRGAAKVVAALWPDRNDRRADYAYWYSQYNTRTPYEVLSDVPQDRLARVLDFRRALAAEPQVAAVVEEE
jgi:hypothetical protein